MKILFQGGWKARRNPVETKKTIHEYCLCLAKNIVEHGHTIVLTSTRYYDKIIADEVCHICRRKKDKIKNHLLYLLPQREVKIPEYGRVLRFEQSYWWIEERTYFIQHTDAIVALGGGRGTFDCVEKAFLSNKPVFVAGAIPCKATSAWRNRAKEYKYLEEGDADFLDDINASAEEFFKHVFSIINKLSRLFYSRRIFIVHGRDLLARDSLADILRRMDFTPVILQEEPSHSLTVVEKLERDIGGVGFAFIIYSPDDIVASREGTKLFRARQNVVFEHGWLIGLLGRDRTCAILQGNIEIPSDIQGMIYERIQDFKSESLKIANVLIQAGYQVDSAKLLN